MNKKSSIIGGAVGILAGVPLLANAIGWSITLIAMAGFIALAVILVKRVRGAPQSRE